MADERRPLLNPVLKFNKDPRPEGITGRGKALAPIRAARLPEQRVKLSNELMDMARSLPRQPRFAGHALVYASMFEDSLAPTWTPHDLFQPDHGASLVAPYKRGYLIEMQEAAVERLSAFIRNFGTLRDQVDL